MSSEKNGNVGSGVPFKVEVLSVEVLSCKHQIIGLKLFNKIFPIKSFHRYDVI